MGSQIINNRLLWLCRWWGKHQGPYTFRSKLNLAWIITMNQMAYWWKKFTEMELISRYKALDLGVLCSVVTCSGYYLDVFLLRCNKLAF